MLERWVAENVRKIEEAKRKIDRAIEAIKKSMDVIDRALLEKLPTYVEVTIRDFRRNLEEFWKELEKLRAAQTFDLAKEYALRIYTREYFVNGLLLAWSYYPIDYKLKNDIANAVFDVGTEIYHLITVLSQLGLCPPHVR